MLWLMVILSFGTHCDWLKKCLAFSRVWQSHILRGGMGARKHQNLVWANQIHSLRIFFQNLEVILMPERTLTPQAMHHSCSQSCRNYRNTQEWHPLFVFFLLDLFDRSQVSHHRRTIPSCVILRFRSYLGVERMRLERMDGERIKRISSWHNISKQKTQITYNNTTTKCSVIFQP